VGKQLTQQDAQAQEVTVRQQLADVQQSKQRSPITMQPWAHCALKSNH